MAQLNRAFFRFFRTESAGGIFLLAFAFLALILANSPIRQGYFDFFDPLHTFINEGLMSIFFFLVGLEIKREFVSKEERSYRSISLPIIAALGGMAIPALIFIVLNNGSKAWAVAMPTDIALALGALALLGSRIEPSIKIFLLTLAIADDLFSIIVMALFYSSGINPLKLLATIGAVVLAIAIPVKPDRLIDILHPYSAFFIIPVFALANIGLTIDFSNISNAITYSLIVARVVGKIIGITLFSFLAISFGLSHKPASLTYVEIAGAGALAGMGLTVSLFIADLAGLAPNQMSDVKLGLILAAIVSGLVGLFILRRCAANPFAVHDEN